MLSLKYKNINYVMTQILKLSCVSFSYVSISYVLALANDVLLTSEILLSYEEAILPKKFEISMPVKF